MSERTKNSKEKSKARRMAELGAGLTTAAAVLAACSGGTEGNSANPESKPATVAATETTAPAPEVETVQPEVLAEQEIKEYINSPERNEALTDFIQDAGWAIVDKFENREDVFDGYYPGLGDENIYMSRELREGWVWLQHNPQWGGSNTQFSTSVYIGADGRVDRSKDPLEVHVRTIKGDNETVSAAELNVPGASAIAQGEEPYELDTIVRSSYDDGELWRIIRGDIAWATSSHKIDESTPMVGLEDVQAIDQGAVNTIAEFLGIEPVELP